MLAMRPVRPESRRRFRIAAVVLASGAIIATVAMISSGFITAGPGWLVTVAGTVVAFAAIGAVLCLFLILFE
jgi:hypothetical protein